MVNGVGKLDKLVRNPPFSYLTLPPPENNRPNLFATTSATRGGYPVKQAVLTGLAGVRHAVAQSACLSLLVVADKPHSELLIVACSRPLNFLVPPLAPQDAQSQH